MKNDTDRNFFYAEYLGIENVLSKEECKSFTERWGGEDRLDKFLKDFKPGDRVRINCNEAGIPHKKKDVEDSIRKGLSQYVILEGNKYRVNFQARFFRLIGDTHYTIY